LNDFEDGARITPEDLLDRQILRNLKRPVKIVGDGELTKKVTVAAHRFTRSARERIEAVEGRVEEL
jgi:large subunit ribosomal protein L15